MNALINAMGRSRVAANLLLIGILAAGISALYNTTVRLFPEIEVEQIMVTVPFPGATPDEVEQSIVKPIEERVEGLEDVRKIRSTAAPDVGQVLIFLYQGVNVSEALDEVKSEIDRILVFPEGAEEPEVVRVEPQEQVLQIALSADLPPTDASVKTLKEIADRARDEITRLPGVSQAELSGVADYQISIAIPRQTLKAHHTSLVEVADIVGNQSLELSAGEIESPRDRLLVRTLGENRTGEEFGEIVLFTGESGAATRVRDLGEVIDGFEDTPVTTRVDGKPAVLVTIFRTGDEQILEVIDQVENYLSGRLSPQLPETVSVQVWRDDARPLENRIQLLIRNGALGICLVVLILALFLDLRVAAWVAVGIFASFVGAFGLMAVFGISINALSLFGFILAIGIVVDDAIVVGENAHSHHQRRGGEKSDSSGLDRAIEAAQRVSRPVFFAVSTTIIAFVPLLFLPGLAGQFVNNIAAIVIFTLVLSLTESFFVLPHHLAGVRPEAPRRFSPRRFSESVRHRVDNALHRFVRGPLRQAVSFTVGHPLFTVACATALLLAAGGLLAGGYVKFVFFPQIEGNYVTATLEIPQNSPELLTLETAQRLETAIDRAAGEIADRHGIQVAEVVSGSLITVGRPARSNEPGQERRVGAKANLATVTARIMDADIRSFEAVEFEDAWRQAAPEIAGARQLSFSSSLVDVGAPVALEISANSESTVNEVVEAMRQELGSIEGVYEIRDDRFRTTDEIALELKPEARRYGVTLSQLARSVRAAVFGAEAVRVQRGREEVVVRVRLPEHQRDSLGDLEAYEIAVPGGYIPLGMVAELERRPAPARIDRLDGRRITTVYADTNPDITTGGEATAHILSSVLPGLQAKHPDLRVTVGGEQEEQGRTTPALASNFLLALFAIYALMALAFNAYTRPFILLLTIPFGFIGALAGHMLLGLNLTMLSLFGIVGLSGVIINDALLMLDFVGEKRRQGMAAAEAIIESALDRFRPILLTSLTTFFGVFPLILERSVQAKFLIPTAVSLGFGILFGTFLLMLLVPALAILHSQLTENGRAPQA
ncbi:efflux RND transporter permease subunit [Marinobacter sp.]|uniref:efflux RND transporter permease subunit n=1 Tax=Marinobacter sp. TaxID=50741 RepID=UPI0038500A16